MEEIQHRTVKANGINIHIAEKGQGPIILFLHGFPELWYSWRHQIHALSSLGYRAVAPDLRGFGDTDAPADGTSYTSLHVVGDIIGVLDAIGADRVFVVGHDWGALMAWYLCLYRPDRVKALVNMSVPFSPRNPMRKPLESLRAQLGDDYYICRFQEPGVIETEFAEIGVDRVLKHFLTYRNPAPLFLPKGNAFGDDPATPIVLPSWLSEEEVHYYTTKYQKTGFTGGLNYYRSLNRTIEPELLVWLRIVLFCNLLQELIGGLSIRHSSFIPYGRNWELTAAFTGYQSKVPTKFIVGDHDMTYHAPGSKDFIHGGGLKKYVPLLEDVIVMEGVGHFIHEEKADEINKHIYDFFQQF